MNALHTNELKQSFIHVSEAAIYGREDMDELLREVIGMEGITVLSGCRAE